MDIETLEILEGLLLDFKGTLLLVSHDRAFMNNVVTSTLAFEGGGIVNDYVGGYDDWLRQRPEKGKKQSATKKAAAKPAETPTVAEPKPKKLSYKDQRELDQLPDRIDALETQQQELEAQLADPSIYEGDGSKAKPLLEQMEKVNAELEEAFLRWEELDAG